MVPIVVVNECVVVNLSEEGKRKRRKAETGKVVFARHVSEDLGCVCVFQWSVLCGLSEDGARAAVLLDVPVGKEWKVSLKREPIELTASVKRWNDIVTLLAARRKYLLETVAQISTLGGGWASVGQRKRARQYAEQQRNVAKMLGDDTLELLSNVYIGYALLFEGQHEQARSVIAAQTKLAQKRGDKRQLQIVEAARLQLQRWDEEQEKKTQN